MTAAGRQLSDDPLAFIRDPELFGNLAERAEFAEPYLRALRSFHDRGARTTIAALVGRQAGQPNAVLGT